MGCFLLSGPYEQHILTFPRPDRKLAWGQTVYKHVWLSELRKIHFSTDEFTELISKRGHSIASEIFMVLQIYLPSHFKKWLSCVCPSKLTVSSLEFQI